MPRRAKSPAERVEGKYDVDPETGCWIWNWRTNQAGYGTIYIASPIRRTLMAHRVVYELHKGPIPEGLDLDHLCRVPLCVNPDHLDPVTRSVNLARSPLRVNGKDRCSKGHPYTEENTYHHGGGRYCRACHRDRVAKYDAKKRGETDFVSNRRDIGGVAPDERTIGGL